jgi:putative DNA primase/helicase
MAGLDFDGLARQLLASAETHLASWLPAGRKRGNSWVAGDLSGAAGQSLKVNLATGAWSDFATGDHGSDLVSLYAAIYELPMGDAYRHLGGETKPAKRVNGHAHAAQPPEPARRVVTPVPADFAECPCVHTRYGKPSARWTYRNTDGEVLGYIARYDPQGERKQIIPWTWDGERWGMGQWPSPRPLYGLQELEARPDSAILVVEGEKAAEAARRFAGPYVVVTWPAGAMAADKADWTPLAGRKVLLWPDADEPGRKAMERVAQIIHERVSEVKVLEVSDQPDGWDAADAEFSGWNDCKAWMKPRAAKWKPIAALTTAPTQVVDSETGEITEPGEETAPIISNATPMKTAEVFHESLPEGGRIVFWRGEFFSWDGTRYVVRDRVYIEQRLYRFMAQCNTWKPEPKSDKLTLVPYNPKAANVNDVAHALRAVCYADLPDPQVWIEDQDGDMPAHEIVAFRNGFFHYPTRALVSSTDRMWVTNALDFDYDSKAGEPREWLDFLASLWPSDPESVRALAEMFGYLLTDDTGQQKMFMLVGPPRSGKGTILRVLEALVGYHNRVSPSLASLGTQFGLQPLIGKRLALISDARLSGRADQQPIVENLLRISGEDALTIDRKNIVPWSGKLPARFVLATNELPAFSDASAALANRFLMLKLTKSFLGQEDQGLTSRLLKELPGIVLWALDGLERLRHRGYFQRPSSADDLAADLLEQTSPVRSFVEDCCVLDPVAQCNRDDIFRAWKRWCELQGRDHPGTKVGFGRQLSAAFSSISRSQPREDGTRLNLYTGIRLTEKWKWEAQQV